MAKYAHRKGMGERCAWRYNFHRAGCKGNHRASTCCEPVPPSSTQLERQWRRGVSIPVAWDQMSAGGGSWRLPG